MATNKKPNKESALKKKKYPEDRILSSVKDFYMQGVAEHSDQVYGMSRWPAQAKGNDTARKAPNQKLLLWVET
ncbi:unnamed protein product [Dovyalis caffra]|uniref:Uncharacterized protein n=1 Tax=Dovyalis caffra TaxID=77055 RepID=A0AAV1S7H4_9ROSI|nr:unnamed protein product [Dovyalis caffra]